MAVPIFGLAKAVQMVAAGLERGESPTSILSRIVETGAVSTIEEGDAAFSLGRIAFSAGAQLALGNNQAADRLIAQLGDMGAGSWVATAKVEVQLSQAQRDALVAQGKIKVDEPVFRTLQVNIGGNATSQQIAAALQDSAAELAKASLGQSDYFGGTLGMILPYSIVRLADDAEA